MRLSACHECLLDPNHNASVGSESGWSRMMMTRELVGARAEMYIMERGSKRSEDLKKANKK